jgi:hypothetical protein
VKKKVGDELVIKDGDRRSLKLIGRSRNDS